MEVLANSSGWGRSLGNVGHDGKIGHNGKVGYPTRVEDTTPSSAVDDAGLALIGREPPRTTRLAQRTFHMLRMLGSEIDKGASAKQTASMMRSVHVEHVDTITVPRVLVLEPRSGIFGRALRRLGFSGEVWALLRGSAAYTPLTAQLRAGYDNIVFWDWSEVVEDPDSIPTSGATIESPPDLGSFSAVVASDISRLVPADQRSALFSFLGSLVQVRGYLLVSEPYPDVDMSLVERHLMHDGFLLASDPEPSEDDWPRTLATFQKRGDEEAHLIGQLHRITWPMVETDAALQDNIAETYREVFGGDEWQEWLRCTRPGVTHKYSRREAALLSPPGRCTCGWHMPLVPFHTQDAVMEKMYHDIARQHASCCYMRINKESTVEGFTWGYIADVADVAHILTANAGGAACDDLRTRIAAFMHEISGDRASEAMTPVLEQKIFYHSELGVREAARSLSLARGLFHRAFQFAYDMNISTVVLRTTMTSPAYDICMGLGMRMLYRYGKISGESDSNNHRHSSVPLANTTHAHHRHVRMEIDAMRERPPTDHVVVGGSLREMLRFLGGESDRRLVMRMLRVKRGGHERGS